MFEPIDVTRAPSARGCSLQLLLHRYPDYQTGIGRWDSELLKYTKEKGPRAIRILGHPTGNNFDADLVGDLYLFSRLHGLASSDLLTARHDIRIPCEMRNCEVILTNAGEYVVMSTGRSARAC